jgi:hypothetical protein
VIRLGLGVRCGLKTDPEIREVPNGDIAEPFKMARNFFGVVLSPSNLLRENLHYAGAGEATMAILIHWAHIGRALQLL